MTDCLLITAWLQAAGGCWRGCGWDANTGAVATTMLHVVSPQHNTQQQQLSSGGVSHLIPPPATTDHLPSLPATSSHYHPPAYLSFQLYLSLGPPLLLASPSTITLALPQEMRFPFAPFALEMFLRRVCMKSQC